MYLVHVPSTCIYIKKETLCRVLVLKMYGVYLTGYLSVFCQVLLEEIDKLPGDSRAQIGFIAYDRALHFFNLAEGLSQPQMLTVSDIDGMSSYQKNGIKISGIKQI